MEGVAAESEMAVGMAALGRGDWAGARVAFAAAIQSDAASADAFLHLGNALVGLGEMEAAFAAYEEAYLRHRAAGDDRGAGRVAVRLSWNASKIRGEPAVANGWAQRAHRMLDPLDRCFEQARLMLVEADALLFAARDPESARALARGAQEIGREVSDPDSELVGIALGGLATVSMGKPVEGMAALDEAAVAVTAGEVRELLSVGITFCYLIFACEKVRDYDRAGEWCARLRDFTEKKAHHGLLGVCRAHLAGVYVAGGDWAAAEEELRSSRRLLSVHARGMAPEAELRLAELRRRQGRLTEAEALLRELPRHPLTALGRAAVALDRGQAAATLELAAQALADVPVSNSTERAAGYELIVRGSVLLGDTDRAALALERLNAVADAVRTAPLQAAASMGAGLLARARGDHLEARRQLERAVVGYGRGRAPYEAACARLELADTLGALDHPALAAGQRAEALGVLEALGVDSREAGPEDPLTAREREVLTLMAGGASDCDIAGCLGISEHTVHRHAANVRGKLGVTTRAAAIAHVAHRTV